MTEKKLRDDIIVKMLDYKDKTNVNIDDFCLANQIEFSSGTEMNRIFKSIREEGYIAATLISGGGGSFTITSKGIDYAEKLLEEVRGIIGGTGTTEAPKKPIKKIKSQLYSTQNIDKGTSDSNIKPCFNVKSIAECYVDLIDGACENEENNVCLFGIFAPWGRGKTYFFKKVKEYINARNSLKATQYDVVEFNAWKYQETPAIWAYLFETLYNSKSWWFKFRYTIKRNWESIICDLLKYSIPIIIIFFISAIDNKINIIKWCGASSFLSASLFICKLLLKHYNSALSIMKKYSKGISFANELGVQAEIEKEIKSLLKFWVDKKNFILKFFIRKKIKNILKLVIYLRRIYISKILSGKKERCCNRKVILYIDDIDRCSETKMTSIIDSLRTVLENEDIRNRLIIICSIDPEKIIKGIEYKYQTIYDDKEERRTIAIDQMDKIFLTGIALSELDKEQLLEFTSKLTEVNDNSIFKQQLQTSGGENITTSDDRTVLIDDSPEIEEQMKLDDPEIYKQLKELINNNEKPLTPRKIRIIYYRILLANNIICKMKNPKITNALIQNIFNLSIGEKINHDETSNELSEVLNMVVPYRYNKENEVEEDKEGKVAS